MHLLSSRGFTLLLSALSVCTTVDIQAKDVTAARSGKWSAKSTWSSGSIPGEGDKVTIAPGTDVVLDTSPARLDGITINGKLRFADEADVSLSSEWIMIHGELEIGTETRPFTHKATITLTDNIKDEQVMGMGDRGIMLSGGTLNLHGSRTNSWTKLANTAGAGSKTIEVVNAAQWQVGDQIVLASTDYNPRQAEVRRIEAISGNRLTLDQPLKYMHYGEITYGVDERGEIGLLTRNIRIQASEDAAESHFGGHIMAMVTSRMFVEGVELSRMGQHLELARYPIHWHLIGDGKGQYIRNAAIHDTYNRCVTVHGTNNVRVENNVTYNTIGHCFFLEDGVEHGNVFARNLGIQTKCHPSKPCVPTNLAPGRPAAGPSGQTSKEVLLPSDNTASTFWITNPDNTYVDNVAAGSDQIGFWFALPEHPNGAFEGTEVSANTWPRRTNVREFNGNVAHSNFDGMMFDRGPRADNTFSVAGSDYHFAYANPARPDDKPLVTQFSNFTSYKNRNGGLWARGEMHQFSNLKLADNATGFTHAGGMPNSQAFTSRVIDSLFVGETDNIGNPTTPAEIAYGRSLPTEHADYPIRGYEYYDFRNDVFDSTFVNFQPNETREAGAISYLMYTSFGSSSENSVKGLHFVNSQRVTFPPVVLKWASDSGRRGAWSGAAIHDHDGSVGGVPDSYIVIDNGIATDDEACNIRPRWGAAVCKGDYGRLDIAGNFGFGDTPIIDPIMLSRNGRRFEYVNETAIRGGTTVRVETSRKSLSISLREMNKGSFVIFELPGFSTSAGGVEQKSLEALRSTGESAWFHDGKTLWVKLVVDHEAADGPIINVIGNMRAQANVQVGKGGSTALARQ